MRFLNLIMKTIFGILKNALVEVIEKFKQKH